MRIAIASQDHVHVSPQAGRCRHFLVYDWERGRLGDPRALTLSAGQRLQDVASDLEHPLGGVDILIAGALGDALRDRLARSGIRSLATTVADASCAARRFIHGVLPEIEPGCVAPAGACPGIACGGCAVGVLREAA